MDVSQLKTTRRLANLRAGRNDWYRIKAQDTGPSQVMIYDEIGFFGVTAQDFINDLKQVDGPVDLHLNSPGGDVFDGIAIYQFLAGRGGVTTYVDSLAASIASVIAMAGSEIIMGRNATMMIHDGWGLCVGNAADMREQADLLDRVSDNIASIYADRTGKPVDEWRKLMLAESWYFGHEAVDAGLADRLAAGPAKPQPDTAPPGEDDAPMAAHFDLSVFRNTPERLRNLRNHAPDPANAPAPTVTDETAPVGADTPPEPDPAPAESPPTVAPAPTTPQPTDQAPDPTGRGFPVAAGGPMTDSAGIPREQFRAWLEQGLQLVDAPAVDPHAAAMHEPYDGTHTHAHPAMGAQGDDTTHEHEHTHNGDADHGHDHPNGDGEDDDTDGGMQNAHRAPQPLGAESMPLLADKALPVHHTATVDEAWDGPAAVAAMPNDDTVLEYCHAWQSAEAAATPHRDGDDDADDQKSNYKFPHHKTKGGPANLAACRNGLARLEGSTIPDSDKPGVDKHLQAHLDDAKSADDGASNSLHEHPDDGWSWDPEIFRQAVKGA